MPKRKSPARLQSICICQISEILHQLNFVDLPEDFPWYDVDINPIRYLPNVVVQEIITHVGASTTTVRKHVMRLLLSRNVDHLDLSSVHLEDADMAEVLRMVLSITKNLRTLCLVAQSTEINEEEYVARYGIYDASVQLIGSLTNITHLYLHNLCCDEILDAVGRSCPNLVMLRALSEYVTDEGLKALCADVSNPGPLRCQKLEKISIDPCAEKITEDGVFFLLRHSPCLKEIEGCLTGQVLLTAHENDFDTTNVTYRMVYFMHDWRESNCSPSLISKIASRTCPLITTLNLLEPTDEALAILGRLRHLKDVTAITYSDTMSFEGGILPLLKTSGTNVVKLSLVLKKIDLGAIDYCCPKLRNLNCNMVEEIFDSDLKNMTSYVNLHELTFHSNSMATLSARHLKMLLCFCVDLQYLYVSGCNHLTDQLLTEIILVNPLKRLQNLHLMYVEGLTYDGIEMLVNQDNELRRIWMFDFGGRYRMSLQKIRERIKEFNLDLMINDEVI